MNDVVNIAKANADYALQEQRYAMKLFPESKTVGEALTKWYASDTGKRVRSAYLSHCYEDMQKRGALGRSDGSTGGMERDDNSHHRTMTASELNPNDDDDDDEDKEVHTSTNRRDTRPRQQRFAESVKALMKSDGLNFDQAATAVIKRGY